MSNFAITADVLETLIFLPEDQQTDIEIWVDQLRRVHQAPKGKKGDIIDEIAAARHCSPQCVRLRYDKVRKGGPAALIDRRKIRLDTAHGNQCELPEATRKFIQGLYYKFQRKNGGPTVWQALIDRWSDWRRGVEKSKIPGYDTPPPANPRTGYPAGWSLRTIQRCVPGDFELFLARQGKQKAALSLPSIITTRVGLACGQIIAIDDQEYDTEVHWRGGIHRPLGFNAMDLFSGYDFARTFKPMLKNETAGNKALNSAQSIWFLIHILTTTGWRTDTGTQILAEAGTASVPKPIAERIYEVTSQKVTVNTGSIDRKPLAGTYYQGISRGNPRHKPGRESWFNLFRNRAAMLKGPTGQSRDHRPEHFEAWKKRNEKILTAAIEKIPNHLHPYLYLADVHPWPRFVQLANAIAEAINHRTHHNLEGWEKLGHQTIDYILNDPTPGHPDTINEHQLMALPDAQRALITANATPIQRNLSPSEVWHAQRKTGHWRKLTPWDYRKIVPTKLARATTVAHDHGISFQDRTVGPDRYSYYPTLKRRDGTTHTLRPKTEILLYANPYDPTYALITQPDGVTLGLATLIEAGTRLDDDALARQYGQRNALKAELSADLEAHLGELARAQQEGQARNDQLLDGTFQEPHTEDPDDTYGHDPETPHQPHGNRHILPVATIANGTEDPDDYGDFEDPDPDITQLN